MAKRVNLPHFEELMRMTVPSLKTSQKAALAGGAVTLTVILISALIVGTAFDDPLGLIKSVYPTTRFLSSSVIAATATILALMLTILSISKNTNNVSDTVYVRISKLAFVDTLTFIGGVIFLSLHNLPITESDQVLSSKALMNAYFITIGIAGLLSGALVYIAIMLYFTVKDLIIHQSRKNVED